jgi:hypothetical protein
VNSVTVGAGKRISMADVVGVAIHSYHVKIDLAGLDVVIEASSVFGNDLVAAQATPLPAVYGRAILFARIVSYGRLLAMWIENLEACRQNGMLRLDIDIDSVFAIMFSKLPWSNDKVKGKVFDLDIFQLPAIVRPLMIVPPPKHYTDTLQVYKYATTTIKEKSTCNKIVTASEF